MAFSAQSLMALPIAPRQVTYDARTAMHYGLAVGMAADRRDPRELAFVYEQNLTPVPSLATVLGFDDSWIVPAGIDMTRVVHGAQRLTFLKALPASGRLSIACRIAGVVDKGAGRGTLIIQETSLNPAEGGSAYAIGQSTLFVRGAGGIGGSAGIAPEAHVLPARAPDRVLVQPTAQNQALYFRLLGDYNPLHASPEAARQAGFELPILHGACTYGIACATILRGCCDFDPARLREFEARFVGPVIPGENLAFLLWLDGDTVSFRAVSAERGVTVLDNGRAVVAPAAGERRSGG